MSSPARPFRLSDTRRIAELFDRGLRAGDRFVMLVGLPNHLARTRLATGVGRRAHGSAVRRNRVKRLCREAFRRIYNELPAGWDLVMLPRAGRGHTVDQLALSLHLLALQLAATAAARDDG